MVNWLPRRSVSLPPQPTIAGPCHVSCDTMILVALPPIPEVAPQDNARGQNRSSYLSLSLSQQPIYIYVCIFSALVLQGIHLRSTIDRKERRGIRRIRYFLEEIGSWKSARFVFSNREGGSREGEVGVSGVY